MDEPKDYQGPFIYGGPHTLEAARRCGYPEYMLRLSKPIPLPDRGQAQRDMPLREVSK